MIMDLYLEFTVVKFKMLYYICFSFMVDIAWNEEFL